MLPHPRRHCQAQDRADKKGTGHHLTRNLLILRGHDSNFGPSPAGDIAGHERRAPHGALGRPAGIPGIGARIITRGEQGAVLALANLRIGTQGQVAGMPRDQPTGRPERIGRTARRGLGRGILHEAGADRVPIEIPEGGEGVGIVLHQTGAIAALPEVAPALPHPMEGLGAFRHEPAERPAEGVQLGRLEQ